MRMRGVIQVLSVGLCGLLVLTYIAAKVDFFTQYFRLGTREYLREHSIYWLAIAAILFLIWLTDRLLHNRR